MANTDNKYDEESKRTASGSIKNKTIRKMNYLRSQETIPPTFSEMMDYLLEKATAEVKVPDDYKG